MQLYHETSGFYRFLTLPRVILPRHLPAFLPNLFPQPFWLYHCDGIAEAHCPGKHHLFLVRAEFQKNRAVFMLHNQLIFVPFALKDVVRHFCGKKKFIFFRRLRIVPDSKVQVDVPVDVKIFWNGKTLAGRKNVFYPRQCKNPKIRRAVVKTKNIPVSFLADNVIAVKNLFLKNLAPGTFVSERNNTAAIYRLENLIENLGVNFWQRVGNKTDVRVQK